MKNESTCGSSQLDLSNGMKQAMPIDGYGDGYINYASSFVGVEDGAAAVSTSL
jgi:hypothetical protein